MPITINVDMPPQQASTINFETLQSELTNYAQRWIREREVATITQSDYEQNYMPLGECMDRLRNRVHQYYRA